MEPTPPSVTTPSGRVLAYAEWGDPTGLPVFSLHGTPGCRLNRHPNDELLRSTGARIITYDRPGYGRSDRQSGRVVADAAADVAAIADALGIESFAVTGASGGGPHALACAALLPDRVIRAACVVGVAPYEALGAAWTAGMDPNNVAEFGWALLGAHRLAAELGREDAAIRARVAEDPAKVLGDDWALSEADRAVLGRPDFAENIRAVTMEQNRNGVWGWVDDDLAFVQPWGFSPTTITVPTAVWYGRSDVLVPAVHGQWLAANIPGAQVRIDDLGHLGDPDESTRLRYGWLVAARPWD